MKPSILKRKRSLLFAIVIGIVFFSGCTVLSFYPFYTDEVLITDDRLSRKWMQLPNDLVNANADTMIWEIELRIDKWKKKTNNPYDRGSQKIPNKFTYTLKIYEYRDTTSTSEFNLHLMDINGQKYLDFYPENWSIDSDLMEFHMMPAHTLAKVSMEDTLKLKWMDIEWFENMLDENRIRIHHEQNDNYSLLTAKPEELQKFIHKYGKEEDAWEEGIEYNLVKLPS